MIRLFDHFNIDLIEVTAIPEPQAQVLSSCYLHCHNCVWKSSKMCLFCNNTYHIETNGKRPVYVWIIKTLLYKDWDILIVSALTYCATSHIFKSLKPILYVWLLHCSLMWITLSEFIIAGKKHKRGFKRWFPFLMIEFYT